MLQSYYEDQKREQMQGPALHRLAQEQWQTQLADVPGSSQWQHQQQHHQAAAAHQVESDRSQETDDPVLVQHLRQSTTPASPGLMQRQEGLAPHATNGSLAQSVGPSGMYNRMGVGKAYSSPKPPLARRPPISSEMAFLGSSVDRSADATSSSDQQM